MVKKIKNTDFLYKLLSLVVALGLWFYVGYVEKPNIEVWFHGVSVVYTGDSSLDSYGLTRMTEEETKTVSLKVTGSRGALLSLSSRDITATVDVSNITSSGTYTLPINVSFPSSGLGVTEKDPFNIAIKIEKVVTAEKPVKVEYTGTAPGGIVIESAQPAIQTVTLSGPQSVVEKVTECVAKADISEVTSSGTKPVKIHLKMSDGTVTDNPDVSLSNTHTDVAFTVKMTKTVSVSADILNFGDFNVKRINVTPHDVSVTGDSEVLDSLTEIKTEPFSISEADTAYKKKLSLPDGVTCEQGEVEIQIVFQ